MVPKRHFPDEEDDDDFPVPLRDSKRRSMFKTVIGDLTKGLSLNEAVWEPFLRRVIRDEVERVVFSVLNTSSRSSVHQASSSGGKGLQLHFENKLPPTIFTGSKVESDEASSVKIILIDASSNTMVKSGPLSSIKIEIVALNGDFGSDDQEDWTDKEFNDSVVREREGKRPLVTGELTLTLREGVGYVGNVVFTDNSSWIRSRKFRLGARVVQKISGEVRIREARSEPFVVKDHRGELYRKHHPPQLHDEIWRLERIAKDGAFHKKLSSHGIETVKDFLQLYMRDSSSLREILSAVSNRTWNVIVQHAMNFEDDNKLYAYHRPEQQDVVIFFNSIHKVVGASFSGHLCSLDEFIPSQKALVENLKQHAYRNLKDIVPVDLPISGLSRPVPSLQPEPYNDPSLELQHGFPIVQQDQPVTQLSLSQSSTQPLYPSEAGGSHQIVLSAPQNSHPFHGLPQMRNSFSFDDFFSTQQNGEPSWCPNGSQGPIAPSNHFTTDNLFQVQPPSLSPLNTTWDQGPNFFFTSNNEAEEEGNFPSVQNFVHIAGDTRRKASWCKIRAAFKFWLSVKLAARRMARPVYLSY